jgi:hypothetical protein
MSLLFNGTSDRADIAAAIVTATPCTLVCWVKASSINVNLSSILQIADDTGGQNNFRLQTGDGASQVVVANSRAASSSSEASSTLGISDTTLWHLATARFISSTSRAADLDGSNRGDNTTSSTPVSLAITRAGLRVGGDAGFAGRLAHMAVYNVALSDAQISALRTTTPASVLPGNLVAYWPMTAAGTPGNDVIGSNHFTITGASYSVDNPLATGVGRFGMRGGMRALAGGMR